VVASLVGPPAQRLFQVLAPFGFFIIIGLSYTGLLGAIMNPIFGAFLSFLRAILV